MMTLYSISTMAPSLIALTGFLIAAAFVQLHVAKYAHKTARGRKEIKITKDNLELAKLLSKVLPTIPVLIHLFALAAFQH